MTKEWTFKQITTKGYKQEKEAGAGAGTSKEEFTYRPVDLQAELHRPPWKRDSEGTQPCHTWF